jgi:hypothetical protein
MKYFYGLLVLLSITFSFAQEEEDTLKYKDKFFFGLNANQSAYSNWYAGGQSTIAGTIFLGYNGIYDIEKWKISFDTYTAYGLSYQDSYFAKTEDKIQLNLDIDYKLSPKWYLTYETGFNTQYSKGFADYELRNQFASNFMAPGFWLNTVGVTYEPFEGFSILLSPLTNRNTWVLNDSLANAGAFGVDKAVYDDVTGDLITPGKQYLGQFGAYLKIQFDKEIAKNVNLFSRLQLFSNYLYKPQNIILNWETRFNFKINDWLTTNLAFQLVYDDNIKTASFDDTGNLISESPKLQFKEVLSIGLNFNFGELKD